MRIIILVLLLAISHMATAQEEEKLLTPEEMKVDADIYFKALYKNHPNPYYYCGMREFEEKKSKIYEQLNKPLTRMEFGWVMAEINSCLDAHSHVPFQSLGYQDRNGELMKIDFKFFPSITIRDKKMFLADNTKDDIVEINGISTNQMLSDCWKYFNWEIPLAVNIDYLETWLIKLFYFKYDIRAPYEVKFSNSNKTKTIKGVSVKDTFEKNFHIMGMRYTFAKDETQMDTIKYKTYDYKIFEHNSIAIFYMNSFASGYEDEFKNIRERFMKEVNDLNIKYVFYDLSKNGGGNIIGQNKTFDIVKHDTVFLKRLEIDRVDNFNTRKTLPEILAEPNADSNIRDDRQLFVLQSILTQSRADYYCRVVAQNKLGVRVGQDTGEAAAAFTYAFDHTMPNSNIWFQIARTFLDFSDYFDSETLKPDMYWDINHNREFTEKELLDIIEHWEKQ